MNESGFEWEDAVVVERNDLLDCNDRIFYYKKRTRSPKYALGFSQPISMAKAVDSGNIFGRTFRDWAMVHVLKDSSYGMAALTTGCSGCAVT